MPPRQDFSIIHFRALSDPRYDALGDRLVRLRLAVPLTAADTARAMAARLALWCLRLDDREGSLPGDGVAAARSALGLGPKDATNFLAAMKEADLLETMPNSLRLRGFREAYKKLYATRDSAKARKPLAEGSPNLRRTFAEGSPPTVAVAVSVAGSVEEEPKAKAPPTYTPRAEDDGSKGQTHLSPGLANRLAIEGVRLRERPGEWWEWEKSVTAAVTSRGVDPVLAWLRDPENATRSWKAFLFAFTPQVDDGSRRFKDGAPPPKVSAEEARAIVARLYPKERAS